MNFEFILLIYFKQYKVCCRKYRYTVRIMFFEDDSKFYFFFFGNILDVLSFPYE